jgi:hypothetical protein
MSVSCKTAKEMKDTRMDLVEETTCRMLDGSDSGSIAVLNTSRYKS